MMWDENQAKALTKQFKQLPSVLEVPLFGCHTCLESFVPLVNCFIDDSLLHLRPHLPSAAVATLWSWYPTANDSIN